MAQDTHHYLIITGPESSGKTTLAERLAREFDLPLVPEVARSYFAERGTTHYDSADLLAIAERQHAAERAASEQGAPWVVADTDQFVLQLWWQEKFGAVPERLLELRPNALELSLRHYLLCYPDLAWEPDPLRENPSDRQRLFRLQLAALEERSANYRVIWGQGEQRNRLARSYVNSLLLQKSLVV